MSLMGNDERRFMWNLAFVGQSPIVVLDSKHIVRFVRSSLTAFSWHLDTSQIGTV